MAAQTDTTQAALRLVRPEGGGDAGTGARPRPDPAALFLLATALVPIVGFLVLGHWSERELGVAAGLAATALWCLADPD